MLIWYLARGAGIAGFAALSVATGVGAAVSRRSVHYERRVLWQYVHRAAALSGVSLLIGHLLFLLADSYARVGWVGALVPFASAYRPWQVTLGLIALYLFVAISVSGVLRSRFAQSERGAGLWRGIHVFSYLGWALSALHFLVTGTDSGTWWARSILVGGVAVVLTGVIRRLAGAPVTEITRHSAPQLQVNGATR
jgi:hypothetical protein